MLRTKTLLNLAIVTLSTTAAVLFAQPVAVADEPPPGSSCVGLPSVPAALVCVVSVDPAAAPPTVSSGAETIVTIPAVCYLLSCTEPVDVYEVAVSGSGTYAVVYYNGQTYAVAVPPLPGDEPEPSPLSVRPSDAVALVAGVVCVTGGGTVVPSPSTPGYWACGGGQAVVHEVALRLYQAGAALREQGL